MTRPADDETRGLVLGFLGVAAFSLTLPVTRGIVEHFTPVMIGLGRAVIAALVAGAILLATRQPRPARGDLARLALVAAGVVFGFPLLSAWAMQHVPAAHGGVVLGLLPLATAAVGALLAGERPSGRFWAAGLTGSAAVVGFALLDGGGEFGVADLALAGAVLAAAVGYGEGGRLARRLGAWQVICWALVVSLPFLLVPVGIEIARHGLAAPPIAWVGFLYLSLVSQLFGFFLWYRGLALGGIARVSQVQLLQVFLTLLASALLLGERIDAVTVGFAIFVVATVAVGRRMPVHRPAT